MKRARYAWLPIIALLTGCGLLARLQPDDPQPPQDLTIGFLCSQCVKDQSGSVIPIGEAPLYVVLFPTPMPDNAVCRWSINDKEHASQPCSIPYAYTFRQPGHYTIQLEAAGRTAQMLVVVRNPLPNTRTVVASSTLVACEQTTPHSISLGQQGLVLVSCQAKTKLDYIYYRSAIGECLLWNQGDDEHMVINVPQGEIWSFSYPVRGVATGVCSIPSEILAVSGKERVTLTLTSIIEVQ